ncbi:MAG: hypothetical protein ACRDID_22805 [Ktedonobacterales bacterium]
MFCSACGSQMSLAAEVCPQCGKPSAAAAPARTLTRGGGIALDVASPSSEADSHDHWTRPPIPADALEMVAAPALSSATHATSAHGASIFAGDLDVPSLPRDLPGRVALLTGLVMAADLLLPWVTLNGEGIAPTRFGLLALVVVLALLAVIAPPLIPRWRRHPLTRMAPFGVGALLLGFGGALWGLAGPLSSTVIAALVSRIFANSGFSGPFPVNSQSGAVLATTPLQVAPAIGLYLFLLGACALVGAGYRMLADDSALYG